MGIRFLCPNGHRLNVKTFLAGKRGICPHCGAKFEIPFDSVASAPPPPAGAPSAMPHGGHPNSPVVQATPHATTAPAAVGSVPAPESADAAPSVLAGGGPTADATSAAGPAEAASFPAAAPLVPATGERSAPGAAPAGNPAPSAAGPPTAPGGPHTAPAIPALPVAPAPAMPDPIAETPIAVWYVRTNSGGQFGPARGDMMRQWLDERRVGPDYLVWREGWPDWKGASAVFAKLAAQGAAVMGSGGCCRGGARAECGG